MQYRKLNGRRGGALKWQDTFFWKNSDLGNTLWKGQKRPQNRGFRLKIKSSVFLGNNLKRKFSKGSVKTAFPRKFQFLSYGQNYSWPIRFEFSLILNITGMDWCLTWIFLHLDNNKWNSGLVWRSFAPGMLSVNEIWVFFDPQYLLNGLVFGAGLFPDFHFLGVDSY